LNLASEQVELHRFDADSESRRLIKSVMLEEVHLDDAMSKKKGDSPNKRENDWIIAAAKETMSESDRRFLTELSLAQVPVARIPILPCKCFWHRFRLEDQGNRAVY